MSLVTIYPAVTVSVMVFAFWPCLVVLVVLVVHVVLVGSSLLPIVLISVAECGYHRGHK